MLDPIIKTDTLRRELESSVDPALLLDPRLERERQEMTRRSWFHKSTSPSSAVVTANPNEEAESVSSENEEDDDMIQTLTPIGVFGDAGIAQVGYSKVEIISSDDTPSNSNSTPRVESPVYSTPVKVTGRGVRTKEAEEKEGGKKEGGGKCEKREDRVSSEGKKGSPSLARKPLPPTPPTKKPQVPHAATCLALVRTDENSTEVEEGVGGYANFAVLPRIPDARDRSLSIPSPLKKPVPLPRMAGTLGRADENGRGLGQSLPANFKPTPSPRKPTLVSSPPSSSPKTPRSQPSQRRKPPICPKPSLTLPRTGPRPSPPLTAPQTPPGGRTLPRHSPPRPHKPSTTTTSASAATPEEANSQGREILREVSPVAPPRRKRNSQTTPTHQKTPIVSPAHSSPEKTICPASSDAGSNSDLPETSSESDLSHSHSKLPPSPFPAPRSPSPSTPSPLGWHEDSNQDSSMVANRSSIPSSLRSSLPPPYSPLLDPSSPGFMADRETSGHSSSFSTQPTSSECSS